MTSFLPSIYYYAIAAFYGDQKAERSGVPYIHHIDEGIIILDAIGASDEAKGAYCLHPIFQSDDALRDFMAPGHGWRILRDYNIDHRVLVLAMEYRRMANSYLSKDQLSDLRKSPLIDVWAMLIADKVQNRKDFELYHIGTHPRREELTTYFCNWMDILEISEERYQELRKLIS